MLESAAEGNSNAPCLRRLSNFLSIWMFQFLLNLLHTLQYHRRLFIINHKLAHMNQQNFINLGAWWAQKMSRAQEKLTAAVEVLLNLALVEPFLRDQWGAQCDAVTKQNPGMRTMHLLLECYKAAINH